MTAWLPAAHPLASLPAFPVSTFANAINGRAWSGNVRILPLAPPQKVEIGIACLDGLSPAAETFFEFLRPQISSLA